jgi:hypothetical protein
MGGAAFLQRSMRDAYGHGEAAVEIVAGMHSNVTPSPSQDVMALTWG